MYEVNKLITFSIFSQEHNFFHDLRIANFANISATKSCERTVIVIVCNFM